MAERQGFRRLRSASEARPSGAGRWANLTNGQVACHPKLALATRLALLRASRYGGHPSRAIESEGWLGGRDSNPDTVVHVFRRPVTSSDLFEFLECFADSSRLVFAGFSAFFAHDSHGKRDLTR